MAGPQVLLGSSGTVLSQHLHRRTQSVTPVTVRHQRAHHAAASLRRQRKQPANQRQLTISAASSVDEDVRRPNDAVRSAQDLAEGVQSFLDDAQRQLSSDESPLPEHPIGEPGSIDVADGIDASVGIDRSAISKLQCSH